MNGAPQKGGLDFGGGTSAFHSPKPRGGSVVSPASRTPKPPNEQRECDLPALPSAPRSHAQARAMYTYQYLREDTS